MVTSALPAGAPRWRVVVLVATAAAVVAVLGLHVVAPQPGIDGDYWPWPLGLMAYPVVAALILARRPGNVVGRTMGVIGLAAGGIFFTHWLTVRDLEAFVSLPAEAVNAALVPLQFGAMIALLYLFPTGRTLEGWHRLAFRLLSLVVAATMVLVLLLPGPLVLTGRTNAMGVLPGWVAPVEAALWPVIMALGLAGVVSLVVRWRQAREVERVQLRWFVLAAMVMLVALLGLTGVEDPDPGALPPWRDIGIGIVIAATLFWSLPAAVATAVLRYRLYEIDRVISRTVTYLVVAGVIVGVYAGGVVGVQALLPASGDLAVAGTTLAVAALFHPLRRRVHRIVDRRFNRATYQAEEVLAAFAAQLRDSTDIDLLAGQVIEVLDQTLQPASASLWIPAR